MVSASKERERNWDIVKGSTIGARVFMRTGSFCRGGLWYITTGRGVKDDRSLGEQGGTEPVSTRGASEGRVDCAPKEGYTERVDWVEQEAYFSGLSGQEKGENR